MEIVIISVAAFVVAILTPALGGRFDLVSRGIVDISIVNALVDLCSVNLWSFRIGFVKN